MSSPGPAADRVFDQLAVFDFAFRFQRFARDRRDGEGQGPFRRDRNRLAGRDFFGFFGAPDPVRPSRLRGALVAANAATKKATTNTVRLSISSSSLGTGRRSVSAVPRMRAAPAAQPMPRGALRPRIRPSASSPRMLVGQQSDPNRSACADVKKMRRCRHGPRGARSPLRARAIAPASADHAHHGAGTVALMDLSIFFAGTAGLDAERAPRPARAARAPWRREAAVRLRRRHAAPAPSLDRAARPRRGLHHPLPRRPLARACPGMLKSLALRERNQPLTDLRAARARRADRGHEDRLRPPAVQALARRAAPRPRRWRATATGSRRCRSSTRAPPPTATCWSRIRVRAISTPVVAQQLGVSPGPRLRAPAARRSGRRRHARAGDGARTRRPQDRDLGRHRAVRGAGDRRARSRRARPRGDLPRRRGPARAGDQPQHRPPGRGARAGRRGQAARAHAPLQPLRRRGDPRRGARGLRRTPLRRATSTRSRCRSPSAAPRRSCAGRTARRASARRPRPTEQGAERPLTRAADRGGHLPLIHSSRSFNPVPRGQEGT